MSDNSISFCQKAACTVFLETALRIFMFTNRTETWLCGNRSSDLRLLLWFRINIQPVQVAVCQLWKTIIVRIRILSANNEIPKHDVLMPSIESRRVLVSLITCHYIHDSSFLAASVLLIGEYPNCFVFVIVDGHWTLTPFNLSFTFRIYVFNSNKIASILRFHMFLHKQAVGFPNYLFVWRLRQKTYTDPRAADPVKAPNVAVRFDKIH
jgi:hypothetical protein